MDVPALNDLLVKLDDYKYNPKQPVGGFQSWLLNENTLGKQGDMCVLFGAPTGVGKTTFTVMELNKSLLDGKKVAYYTTEMDPQDIFTLIGMMRRTPKDKMDELIQSLNGYLYIIDGPLYVKPFEELLQANLVDEIYVDYLDSSMMDADNAAEKSTRLNRAIREFKDYAKQYNKFIWVCAQAKNLPMDQYSSDSFRESTAICNAATLALIMHKKRQGVDDNIDTRYVLDIVKNRHHSAHGSTGTKIYFDIDQKDLMYIERGYSLDGEIEEYKAYYDKKNKLVKTDMFVGQPRSEEFI